MNNGDMPAMAQTNSENICKQTGTPIHMHMGLTKREHFAGRAMQGILASDTQVVVTQEACVKLAVEHADALLAELEKPKGLTDLERELLEALETAKKITERHGILNTFIDDAIAKARDQL